MSSPSAIFDPDDLDAAFDPATVLRGMRYADEGRIREAKWSPDGWELYGSCLGSGGRLYRVDIGFDDEGVEWARCSCPLGGYCKHAVALIVTATRDQKPTPDLDRWRTVLANVLSEIPTADAGVGAPVGLQFSLSSASRYLPTRTVTVRPLTIGKRGKWITTGLSWQRLVYDVAPGQFQRGQYQALRAIGGELQRSSALLGTGIPLTTARSALWTLLSEAADAGVSMVADKASGLTAVEFVKNAQLRLDFVSDGAGGAIMTAAPIIDGGPCCPDGIGVIGTAPSHGMYMVEDGVLRLGPFDPLPGSTTLNLVTRDDRVRIPAEAADEFSLTVLPRLTRAVSVEVGEGLFTPPTVAGPFPVLTIKLTDAGARAYWSCRYEVNDSRHDFAPDSRPTGYRDEAAEDAAWQRVIPALRAVAAASRTWKHQAMQQILRTLDRVINAALLKEQRAIVAAGDSADAVAAAGLATLRGSVNLTHAEIAVLCNEVLPQLDCLDELVVEIDEAAKRFRGSDTEPQLQISATDVAATDWFDLDITVGVDGQTVPLADIFTELASGATHMALPSGVYFRLDTPELCRLKDLIEEARALGEIDDGKVNARSLNATLWAELLALGVVDKQVADWRENLNRLAAARPPVPVEVPASVDATLRDYQCDGLNWLSFLWDNGLGGILADDMGLGKTVQTLALIARANETGARRFLVVAPTSVVSNWATECRKFTPGLETVMVTITDARSDVPLAERAANAHIVVTSYTLLRVDFETYAQIDWAGVILDEAQFVKNHNSKTHQCVRRLDVPFKLAITGTPMENNLMELWSLLSITVPGLFPSPNAFTEYFRRPIESATNSERLPVLRRRIKPVMLRRTKGQVLAELPPKQEQTMTLDLGGKHRKIYDTRLARERQKVLGLLGEWEKNRFQIFRSLTLLRQLSLHAGLVDETNMHVASAKVDYLVTQLPELVAEGHSALVFSQFTGFLNILRSHLDGAGLGYSYLDGSVGRKGRAAAISEFRDGGTKVFLISLRAGGFGLNLTEADFCFVCDPWWSPAAEAQAVDRAHRIGQTRPVSVYRLVSQGTIEEKVVALQERKRALFGAVIDDGEIFGSSITASDVRELLG